MFLCYLLVPGYRIMCFQLGVHFALGCLAVVMRGVASLATGQGPGRLMSCSSPQPAQPRTRRAVSCPAEPAWHMDRASQQSHMRSHVKHSANGESPSSPCTTPGEFLQDRQPWLSQDWYTGRSLHRSARYGLCSGRKCRLLISLSRVQAIFVDQ